MGTPCEKLEPFLDEQLSLEEARAFNAHLTDCERCQADMIGLLQLERLAHDHVQRMGLATPFRNWRRWRTGGAVAALAATIAMVLLWWILHPRSTSATWDATLYAQKTRTQEARLPYGPADDHRPLTRRLGTDETKVTLSLERAALITELVSRKEWPRLVALYLTDANPEAKYAEAAAHEMQKESRWDVADVFCSLGAAKYAEGNLTEALRYFDDALRRNPSHLQSLWNRALVYRQLGLKLLAMQDFALVAKLDQKVGWQKEAAEQRDRLQDVLRRKERWEQARSTGDELIALGGQAADAVNFRDVPMLRRDFYDAVRTRTSAADVLALLKVAKALDGEAGGGHVLADYVQRIARRDFQRRAPLARTYARMFSSSPLSKQEVQALVTASVAASEDDLVVGALAFLANLEVPGASAELARRAEALPDPWFQVMSSQFKADVLAGAGQYEEARQVLEDTLDRCLRARVYYRCIDVESRLSYVSAWLFRLDDAERHARNGLELARQMKQWDKEGVLLQQVGNVYRERKDVVLGRAYFGEALQAIYFPSDRRGTRTIHQSLAHLALIELDFKTAREELDRALATGLPLTVFGAEALVEVARWERTPKDAAELERALESERDASAGKQAYAKFLRGRFWVEQDSVKGRALLEQAIRESEAIKAKDVDAQHARAYSYASLLFEDARQGDFASALLRFGEELGFKTPESCVLALTEDTERSLLVGRGADGRLLQHFEPHRTTRWPVELTGIVPLDMQDAFRACKQVDVLSRPPLQGRAGLFSPDIAWRYRFRAAPPNPQDGKRLYVVIDSVPSQDAKTLPISWPPAPSVQAPRRLLQGTDATPSRVLEAIQDATEVDLAVHGLSNSTLDASFLVLAHDTDGSNELRTERIRAHSLRGAPLIVIAACKGAQGSSALHESESIPNAFLEAGARTVIAAPVPLGSATAALFFAAVRARIQAGSLPGVAVREERLKWTGEKKTTEAKDESEWVNAVVVFE